MCAGIKVAHASGREEMVDPVSSVPPHQTNKQIFFDENEVFIDFVFLCVVRCLKAGRRNTFPGCLDLEGRFGVFCYMGVLTWLRKLIAQNWYGNCGTVNCLFEVWVPNCG
jgi:hypothetical protein